MKCINHTACGMIEQFQFVKLGSCPLRESVINIASSPYFLRNLRYLLFSTISNSSNNLKFRGILYSVGSTISIPSQSTINLTRSSEICESEMNISFCCRRMNPRTRRCRNSGSFPMMRTGMLFVTEAIVRCFPKTPSQACAVTSTSNSWLWFHSRFGVKPQWQLLTRYRLSQ